MFPDPQDAPACLFQSPGHQPVTGLIAGNFFAPECRIALGLCSVFGAAVPKTAIHENGQPVLPENEVRFAEDFLVPPPAGDAVRPEKCHHPQFRVPVPARADAGHHLTALGFGENVRHVLTSR